MAENGQEMEILRVCGFIGIVYLYEMKRKMFTVFFPISIYG